ncbi:hypothetical protein HWV62_36855 [Athelia sp. TMB]|nr:hypothetical protein HWV62_36855 [Athelia sp. TMB]
MFASRLLFSALTVAVCAAGPLARFGDASPLASRTDLTLANGNSMQYGTLPNGLNWQASGVLIKGGCSSTVQFIKDCYELELGSATNKQLDPGFSTPRQRIEFQTPSQNDGTSWKYTWRSYYQKYDTFFLDILQSGVSLKDVKAGAVVATTSVASMLGTPLQHTLTVTYGPAGSINYSIVNSQTQKSIFKYSKANVSVGAGGN